MAHDPSATPQSQDKPSDQPDANTSVPIAPVAALVKKVQNEIKNNEDEYLLDMVFVLDCTGSMASYINSARDNIVKISQQLSKLSENKENTNSSKNSDNSINKNINNKDDASNVQIEGQIDTSAPAAASSAAGSAVEPAVEAPVPFDAVSNESQGLSEASKTAAAETESSKKVETSNPEPKKKLSCKFAVVAYRDHPPQDSSFITQIRCFTSSPMMIQQYLSTLTATGGGDGPEALTTALYDVLNNLDYRPNSQKIIIVITDAPPHGIEDTQTTSDGFPKGDPWPQWKLSSNIEKMGKNNIKHKNKYLGVKTRHSLSGKCKEFEENKEMEDILSICRKITDNLEASFYTVACEPCLSTYYDFARDLMEAMAEMSNGKYLPLANAKLLPKVIIGSVKQQMLIDELTIEIDKEIEELKEEYKLNGKESELTEDVIAEFMEKKWENANITYKEVAIGTLYRKERARDNIELLLNRQECNNLSDFIKKRVKLERLTRDDFRHLSSGTSTSSHATPSATGVILGDVECSIPSLCERSEALDDLVGRSEDLSHSSKMFFKKSKKSSSFSFSNVVNGIGSFFSGLTSSSTMATNKETEKEIVNECMDSIPCSIDEKEEASFDESLKKKKKKRRNKNKNNNNNKSMGDDMVLSMRWGDDNEDNRSCSEDEQEVYEQVRTMDQKGVRKAVSRYMQTRSYS